MNNRHLHLVIYSLALVIFAAMPIIAAQEEISQFESFNFPVIKWKPRLFPTAPGTIVQMSTTYDSVYDALGRGLLKYKIILFKAKTYPSATVRMLDKDGFELCKFWVPSTAFRLIPGTMLLEATGDVDSFRLDVYRRIRDYTIE